MAKHIPYLLLHGIGESLRNARVAKGLTQGGLGTLVGVPQSHISKIEQGGVDLQVSTLSELARALNLELKLVPRHALPAVDGVIRSIAPDPAAASTNDANAILTHYERLIDSLARTHPEVVPPQLAETLRDLRQLRYESADLRALRSALSLLDKAGPQAGAPAKPHKVANQLSRATSLLRRMRNAQVHDAPPAARAQPAFSLADDDDD